MGRRKLPLELIPNEKARRITYEKRKKGMMKKAQEFATLCGVDTCMIIYAPAGSATAAPSIKPEVWPVSPEKVKHIIERYMSKGADRRAKRTVRLPEFFMNLKRKIDAELAKAQLANGEAKYPISEELIGGLSKEDLKMLLGSLGQKLEAAKARLAVMKEDATRRSSHMYDHHVLANDHICDHHHMRGLFQDRSLLGDVLPGQNFHFATPEEMTHSETSSYSPIMGNVSPEDKLWDVLRRADVPASPAPCATLGDAGDLLPSQLMQASSSLGDFQFLDYQLSF